LRRAEDKLSSDIEKNEDKLDLLEPELNNLQTCLAELYQQVLNKQKQYQEAISRQRRLRKQIAFLKQKGFKMSEHNTDLLRILDEKSLSPG
jgi:peptidoglycan hydrolase CwlO-like protein